MKLKRMAGILAVGVVAIVFWAGCIFPTMDLNGYYELWFGPRGAMGILVSTEFPSNTFTGEFRAFTISDWLVFPISGPINQTNELSFFVVPTTGDPRSYVWRGLDYDNDGDADALQCKLMDGEDCTGVVLPKLG